MAKSNLAAVILAAGQGTRMKSKRAKVLHHVGGLPLYSHPVRLALNFGASPVVLVVGHQADDVKREAESRFPGRLAFALQAEQKGTGHAVKQALPALEGFEGVVLVLYGDVPLLTEQTIDALFAQKSAATPLVALTMVLDAPRGYGRIVRNGEGRVLRVVEEKDASPEQKEIREVNAGIYAIDAQFLRDALGRLKNDNAQGEYYLTDLVELAAQAGGAKTVQIADPSELLGANSRKELAELDALLRRRINARWMAEGITIRDPETTWIGPDVTIGRDTVLEAGVHLRGATTIGEDCRIEVGAILTDARLGDGVEVHAYSVIEDAILGDAAALGPFGRLRPGAELGKKAKVGNFVEVKKSKLGEGAKASHLAYIGDATIGAGANIGAGTITCNYDGFGKHLTEVGARTFVGSNSTLVAPVKIGDDVYVAAGSTLTEDVSANSLVFGRARQVEKPGRAEQVRGEASALAAAAKAKSKGNA